MSHKFPVTLMLVDFSGTFQQLSEQDCIKKPAYAYAASGK